MNEALVFTAAVSISLASFIAGMTFERRFIKRHILKLRRETSQEIVSSALAFVAEHAEPMFDRAHKEYLIAVLQRQIKYVTEDF